MRSIKFIGIIVLTVVLVFSSCNSCNNKKPQEVQVDVDTEIMENINQAKKNILFTSIAFGNRNVN